MSSPSVFSGVRVTKSLVLWVCFVDHCLSFCPSSIYWFWLPLWYLQTLLDSDYHFGIFKLFLIYHINLTLTCFYLPSFYEGYNWSSCFQTTKYYNSYNWFSSWLYLYVPWSPKPLSSLFFMFDLEWLQVCLYYQIFPSKSLQALPEHVF